MERLKNGGGINRIELLSDGKRDRRVDEITELARKSGIAVRFCERAMLDRAAEGAAHQGCICYAVDFEYSDIDNVLELAENRGEKPFLVILDGIVDPHNFGSVIRTSECAGVHGVIIGKNRQVPVNDTVIKVAEGAAEYVKVVRATNINDTIRYLKSKGIWVYALDAGGGNIYAEDLSGAVALVVGAEGKGVSRLTKELCDGVLALPMRGKINSLNASVAAALGIYRKVECDRIAQDK